MTAYLEKAGLLPFLEQLGFTVAAYGCTTCIGNSGPLDDDIERTIVQNDLVCAAVLSGNRNFEARIHPNLRANFLMSPPLVVAFALAGTVLWDPDSDPLGSAKDGSKVYLRDIWPGNAEVNAILDQATDPETYQRLYADPTKDHALWNSVTSVADQVYAWPPSTYIAEPPFFKDFSMQPGAASSITGARCLAHLR